MRRAERGSREWRAALYDHVVIFKVLIFQSSHSQSDERTKCVIKGRLSFMRFLGV